MDWVEKIRNKPFPSHPIIGEEEKRAVLEVLDSGKLSTFIASPGAHFFGGVKIREFEDRFKAYHNMKHAVAFNSATATTRASIVLRSCAPSPLKFLDNSDKRFRLENSFIGKGA